MASLNKCMLIARLGKDPELRFMPNGNAVCNFSVATSESWKDKSSGEKQERTDWHNIVIYGKLAEIAGEYLKKGAMVYLEGKITTRKWQDKQTGADRYTTEIVADQMRMLGGKTEGIGQPAKPAQKTAPNPAPDDDDFEDDIPFN